MTGRRLSEKWGQVHFWLTVIGFNMTFFVQHFLGLMGMPRRVFTYPDLPNWGTFNFISTVGAFVMGASVLVLLWNVFYSLRKGEPAGDNPWEAWTLEWATKSPPPEHNFDSLPPVRSRRPLFDLAHPKNPDAPVASSGKLDSPVMEKNKVAMGSFILSEAFFFVMLIAAYVYYNAFLVKGPSARVLDRGTTAFFTVALLSSSLTMWFAEKKLEQNKQGGFRAWLGVTIALGLVFIIGQGREYLHLFHSGIVINTNLFATSFFTLTGFHGLHVCVGLLALLILLALAFAGDFKPGRAEAVPVLAWYWHFVDAVWIVVFTTVYLVGPSL